MADKTTELEVKNQAQMETANQEETTVEDVTTADASTAVDGDDVKQEDSFFKEELERLKENERIAAERAKELEDAVAEKERIIEIKNRALQAEKKKAPRDVSFDTLKEELKAELRAEQAERDAMHKIQSLASDKTEQEVIMRHYKNTIKLTGDPEADALTAFAVANARRLPALLGRQSTGDIDDMDDHSVRSMGGMARGVQPSSRPKTALEREVEKIVPKEAQKFVKRNLPRR